MRIVYNTYGATLDELTDCIKNFATAGTLFVKGKRNTIKLFDVQGKTINIKSFRVPNLVNRVVYKYFRKSKAQRSFEYGNLLLKMNIGTPQPIAYFENSNWIGLKDSYYISEQLNCDLTFKELVEEPTFPDHENILRQFAQFCFLLHSNGVEFKDHTPGNTLIKKGEEGRYDFYLVDLNRMKFHKTMSFEKRMKNLSHLTPKKEMVAVMSNEYSKHSGEAEELVFNTLWQYTQDFQARFHRKKAFKKRFLK